MLRTSQAAEPRAVSVATKRGSTQRALTAQCALTGVRRSLPNAVSQTSAGSNAGWARRTRRSSTSASLAGGCSTDSVPIDIEAVPAALAHNQISQSPSFSRTAYVFAFLHSAPTFAPFLGSNL